MKYSSLVNAIAVVIERRFSMGYRLPTEEEKQIAFTYRDEFHKRKITATFLAWFLGYSVQYLRSVSAGLMPITPQLVERYNWVLDLVDSNKIKNN